MERRPLSTVRSLITLGQPLAFHVRNPDGTLLLAAGQVIQSDAQFENLLERGAVVEGADVDVASRPDPQRCSAERLPGLWDRALDDLGDFLRAEPVTDFEAALNRASATVSALIERDADLAIFRVVRQGVTPWSQHGVTRSMHAAIAARLGARRLGWDDERAHIAFKAGLTMNLSMLELQGKLANQLTPLVPTQKDAIRQHPLRSAEMLREAGITDARWIEAVEQHHEEAGGRGYPRGLMVASEIAALLRRADVYTAKLTARVNRPAISAQQAARKLYLQEQAHPMTAALIKEFGIYPPGCWVRLASGETGLVVRRGPASNAPLVASLLDGQGRPLGSMVRRMSSEKPHAIVEVIPESSIKAPISTAWLTEALAGKPLVP